MSDESLLILFENCKAQQAQVLHSMCSAGSFLFTSHHRLRVSHTHPQHNQNSLACLFFFLCLLARTPTNKFAELKNGHYLELIRTHYNSHHWSVPSKETHYSGLNAYIFSLECRVMKDCYACLTRCCQN